MREKRASVVVFEAIDLTQEQFDQPIFWLLAGLLAFMPAALGSWEFWAEGIAQAGAYLLALLLAYKLARRRDVPFVWSWTYLPIVLFILLAFIQIIPLPAGLVGAISPKTVSTNQALLGGSPQADHRLQFLRFSFYQEGTWHDLRNLAAVSCVFVVVINVFRRTEQMIQLLWAIAWIGAAEALLAILQDVTGAKGVYWLIPLWGNMRPEGGTYPNHNCYSQFINLSSGAMIGLLLLKIDQTFHRHDYDPAEIVEKLKSASFRWAYVLLAMLAMSLSSVFLSLSRGGMLSIAVAGVVVGLLLAVRGGSRGMGMGGWVAGALMVVAFSIVMAGGSNLVEARISRIGNREDRYNRFQLTKDALREWQDYPVMGVGMGGFRFTFPAYSRANTPAVASHAEDEYAQILQESGIAGAAIAASFLAMIFGCFMRARARGKRNKKQSDEAPEYQTTPPIESGGEKTGESGGDPVSESGAFQSVPSSRRSRGSHRRRGKHVASPASSLCLGLCFGLVAILVQSATDFGQHCISIACLTAISCALLVNLASLRRRERGLDAHSPLARSWPLLRIAAMCAIVGLAIPLLLQANEVREAQADFENEDRLARQLYAQNWQGDAGDFTDMVRSADRAAALRPNQVVYRYRRALDRFDALTANAPTDPVTEDFILNAEQLRELRGLADDLREARWTCPLFGPLDAQLGQWDRSFLGQSAEGARLIRMAFDLCPNDPTVCLTIGTLDGEQGDWAASIKHLQRAVLLDSSELSEVIDLYIRYFHRPDVAIQFASGNVESLHLLASSLRALGKDATAGPTTGPATRPSDEQAAVAADRQADILIRAAADSPDASAQTLGDMGMLCARQNDHAAAVTYLGRALNYEYGQIDWRLQYARSLAKVGRTDDAIHQAEIILRIRPQMPEALDMIDKLSTPSTQAIQELSK